MGLRLSFNPKDFPEATRASICVATVAYVEARCAALRALLAERGMRSSIICVVAWRSHHSPFMRARLISDLRHLEGQLGGRLRAHSLTTDGSRACASRIRPSARGAT